jgi:hypothetical protein
MSCFKMATVHKKTMCLLWFFETKSIINTQLSRNYLADVFYTKHPAESDLASISKPGLNSQVEQSVTFITGQDNYRTPPPQYNLHT